MDDIRFHSISILTEFDKTKKQLKFIRDRHSLKHSIKKQDRQKLTALTNDVIRWRGRLDYWIKSFLKKPRKKVDPKLMNILRAGFYEIMLDDKIPSYATVNTYVELCKRTVGKQQSKLVNALLRKADKIDISENSFDGSDYEFNSLPEWLWNNWISQFGEKRTLTLAEYFNQAPSFSILRLESEINEDEFYSYCKTENVVVEKWTDSKCFYSVVKNLSGLQPLLQSGKLVVQDRAAGNVVELLNPKPGETILDVCAAPGTKTHYIAELMSGSGKLYASDFDENRMNLFSSKWSNLIVNIKNAKEDDYPFADGILIDVPCSGTGVLGKKPDIRWRRSEEEIAMFVQLQSEILTNMSKFIKPMGRIVYSTCSLEQEENWGVVDAFLKLNDHFNVQKETNKHSGSWFDDRGAFAPFPPNSKTDGMFAVKLVNG